MGSFASKAIKKWIGLRKKIGGVTYENKIMFLSQNAKKLTPRAIQYRLKFWAIKQGIPENIHPHLLRHSFASHLLQSSQDLKLKHTSLWDPGFDVRGNELMHGPSQNNTSTTNNIPNKNLIT